MRPACLSTLLLAMLVMAGCSGHRTSSTHSASTPPAKEAASVLGIDPLPSSNDGNAKQAIIDLVKTTTDKSSPKFVSPEDRLDARDPVQVQRGGAAGPVAEKGASAKRQW